MSLSRGNALLTFASNDRKANQLETKHDFKLYTQWTDNYVCDEVASEELWTELVSLARQLLLSGYNAALANDDVSFLR